MVDRNFRNIKYTNPTTGEVEIMPLLKYRFKKIHNFDSKEYTLKHRLDPTSLSKLLSRRVTGAKVKSADSTTGKIIIQLKKDMVWAGPLPWEK